MAKFKVGDVTVSADSTEPTTERTITAVGTKQYLYTTSSVWDGTSEYSYEQKYADNEWVVKARVPKPGDWWAHKVDESRFKVLDYGEPYVVARTFGTNDRVAFPRDEWDADFEYHDWGVAED